MKNEERGGRINQMIVDKASQIASDPLFFQLSDYVTSSAKTYVKLEGLNIAFSIKLKTARYMLAGLKRTYNLMPGQHRVISSSSGSLGVAMAIICAEEGFAFTCVTDPNVLSDNIQLMKAYGAAVVCVKQRDAMGGYLQTRLDYIDDALSKDRMLVWDNQYANADNIGAHYHETAAEIFDELGKVDYLIVGAGTTGTLMGCARYIKEHALPTKLIAVDSLGSVTFNQPPGKRFIPGLGTTRRPPIVDERLIDAIYLVPEWLAVTACRACVKRYQLLLGGSSGSVLALAQYLDQSDYFSSNATVVMISPDFGQKYLETVYDDKWVKQSLDSQEQSTIVCVKEASDD